MHKLRQILLNHINMFVNVKYLIYDARNRVIDSHLYSFLLLTAMFLSAKETVDISSYKCNLN